MTIAWVVIFWAMQAIAQILFKCGANYPERWTLFFILGNVFGASSIWFLMLLYKAMNQNLALAIGTGGGFVAAQAALAIIFRSSVSLLQYAGAGAIVLGMTMFTLGNRA
jgi:multidrug transporter EmrE-like cation transporter